MQDTGYAPWLISLAVIVLQATAIILDIPMGWLTDRIGRKPILVGSAMSLILAAGLMGWNPHIIVYIIGVFCYGLHVVSIFTGSEAILYDTLIVEKKEEMFGKCYGRGWMFMLSGYAIAIFASGYLADSLGYRAVFYLSIVPAVICLAITLLLLEPGLHKSVAQTGKLREAFAVAKAMKHEVLLRALVAIMCLMWATEAFKEGFGQLYMQRYVDAIPFLPDSMTMTVRVAAVFALFYIVWSVGGLVAGYMGGRWMHLLIVMSVVPLVIMSMVDQWWSLIGFMVQALAAGALMVQISVHLQAAIPSTVRGTVTAIRTFIGRLSSLLPIFLIGVLNNVFDIRYGLWLVTVLSVAAQVVWIRYWLVACRTASHDDTHVLVSEGSE